MVLDHLINKYFEELTENDLHIINIIRQNMDDMSAMKIHDLSKLTHTSISTIHRLVKKMGLKAIATLSFT
ncbi:hypothetical protein ACSBQ8_05885 [Staphylococcus equorum]|uniref:hypothetical protein n=1 Tax=Staphylococcus equorum TaxID=246432 RepID=UPI003EC0E769